VSALSNVHALGDEAYRFVYTSRRPRFAQFCRVSNFWTGASTQLGSNGAQRLA
jgi:hypothetical protein